VNKTGKCLALAIQQVYIDCTSAGPIASALTNKFGCRTVAIAGTLIASFGFVVSIWAPNIWFMYFSFGCVAGQYLSVVTHRLQVDLSH